MNEQAVDLLKLQSLREPFPESEIELLPKGKKRADSEDQYCQECGTKHQPHFFHISYVGHAKITAKLLDIDPLWTWEPLEVDGHAVERDHAGNPVGLWIKLTIGGMTRIGHGSVESDANEPMKELIGDALRNAAMRFGLGLDLWIKSKPKARSSTPRASAPTTAPQDEQEASVPSQGAPAEKMEMIRIRKLMKTQHQTHPAVVDGSIAQMSLDQLMDLEASVS